IDPFAAALAQGAMDHPELLDDHLEALQASGFGDPQLEGLASEIIRLRLDWEGGSGLDTTALRRHLAQSGFEAVMREVEKAALRSGAPFLAPGAPLADVKARWSQAFEALTRMAALDDALASAKSEAHQGLD